MVRFCLLAHPAHLLVMPAKPGKGIPTRLTERGRQEPSVGVPPKRISSPREDRPFRPPGAFPAHRHSRPRLRAQAHTGTETYRPLSDYTRADFLQRAGKKTPVFVRFSTVVGGAGSGDLPRERGFALKFYTKEGNFDLIGNNIPVMVS